VGVRISKKYRYLFGWYRKNIHFLDIIWISYRYDIQLFWISFRYHHSKLYRYDIENYIDMISKKYRKNIRKYRIFFRYFRTISIFWYPISMISIPKISKKYPFLSISFGYHIDISKSISSMISTEKISKKYRYF